MTSGTALHMMARRTNARPARKAPVRHMLAAALLAVVWLSPAAARTCNGVPPYGTGTDPRVQLFVMEDASLGTVARPDPTGGNSTIDLSPTGTRTIPPNLVINRDLGISARQPRAATAQISGGIGCDVKITVLSTTGGLQSVTLRDSSTGVPITSGSTVVTNGLGTFTFTIGVSQVVDPSTTTLGGTISIQVSY